MILFRVRREELHIYFSSVIQFESKLVSELLRRCIDSFTINYIHYTLEFAVCELMVEGFSIEDIKLLAEVLYKSFIIFYLDSFVALRFQFCHQSLFKLCFALITQVDTAFHFSLIVNLLVSQNTDFNLSRAAFVKLQAFQLLSLPAHIPLLLRIHHISCQALA